MNAAVAVSIVSYNGRALLDQCLSCVTSQVYRPLEIFLLDNGSTDGTVEFVRSRYPAVNVFSSAQNLGFAAAHNRIIRLTESPFVLVLNQDAFLSETFLKELMAAMTEHPEVGIAGGKLYSARNQQFGNGRPVIDMTWLDIEKTRRQVCYAQGELDVGQADVPRFAFALDGAAMLLRRSMLKDIQVDSEVFDEDFFAGKEDLDLSWRAQLTGWRCLYVPSATGYHLRTFSPSDKRRNISPHLRTASIRNRYLLIFKNDLPAYFARHLPEILFYELQILIYVLLHERSSLRGYAQAICLLPRALKKRSVIMSRKKTTGTYIYEWFK